MVSVRVKLAVKQIVICNYAKAVAVIKKVYNMYYLYFVYYIVIFMRELLCKP